MMTEDEILDQLHGQRIVSAYLEGAQTLYLRLANGVVFAVDASEWLSLCETRMCASCERTVPIDTSGFCMRCGRPA